LEITIGFTALLHGRTRNRFGSAKGLTPCTRAGVITVAFHSGSTPAGVQRTHSFCWFRAAVIGRHLSFALATD